MKNHYPFLLEPLQFETNALEPYIDTKTVSIHHGKHLKTYVDNLNKALEEYPAYHTFSLEKLLYNLDSLPLELQVPIKNNGGGVYNHNLYFRVLTPTKEPLSNGPLLNAINKAFGNLDGLKSELKKSALSVFGSGWALLACNKNGDLQILKLANQETQIPKNLCPIIIIDVWEHAYYLKYENKRYEHIDAIFNVINWLKAEQNYNTFASLDYSALKI
jgi:superoxide dismutase, Fe-Mn family